jgi:hypothetical protein
VERARAFGSVAAEYDRGRPTYPPEAVQWLLGEAPLEVVELGAGTGKLTAALVAAGHRVTAVAFHSLDWFRAFPEIQRLLRPPGMLGLLGNGFELAAPWVARLRELLGGGQLGRPGHWPEADELHGWFACVEDAEFLLTDMVDPAKLRDLALSRSNVATLPPDQRADVLRRIDALWDEEPELRGRAQAPLMYRTRVRRATGLVTEP